MDARDVRNEPVLQPGVWTNLVLEDPSGFAQIGISVDIGDALEDVDFGWDFELLP